MSELVANCPRCKTNKITFDLIADWYFGIRYSWKRSYEAFCICRACSRSTVFILMQSHSDSAKYLRDKSLTAYGGVVNDIMDVESYISLKDLAGAEPPEHLPDNIEAAFKEGAACMAINCINAAATMFRLCIDLSTRAMLPEGEAEGLNQKVRRDLGLRLPWLLDNDILPEALRELSTCIKDDGNDGAHRGNLTQDDAGDILDFTSVLLERIYTEPMRVELAKERREARRSKD